MKRTITLKKSIAFYRNIRLGDIVLNLMRNFKMNANGKYVVTIVEDSKGKYTIEAFDDYAFYYEIYLDTLYRGHLYQGLVCVDKFDELFFVPRKNKRYNITVKKV